MTTSAEASIENSITAIESRLRHSLAAVQTEAEDRLKRLRHYLAERPVRSVIAAFGVGLALARLLQKLN